MRAGPGTPGRRVAAGRRAALVGAALSAGLLVTTVTTGVPPAGAVNVPQATLVTENAADSTPAVLGGSVDAAVQIGSRMFLGGTFTSAQNAGDTSVTFPRTGLLSFDVTTGAVDPGFAPVLDGTVTALETDGSSLYVGGSFTRVGVAPSKGVAKLAVDGTVVGGFSAPANQTVTDLVVRGRRLYVGGAFTTIGSPAVARGGLAALDTTSGAVLPELDLPLAGRNNGGMTGVTKFDVTPDGRTLVAVGNFTSVAGRPRAQIVMVTLPASGPASVAPWATNRYANVCNVIYDTYQRNIDISPDGTYAVVSTTGGYTAGSLCDTTARWEIGPVTQAAQPTWVDETGGDTTYGVAVTGAAVYVGGHFRWQNNPTGNNVAGPGAVPREGLAALDPLNGLPLSWNPGRARGVGAQLMYATSEGLWVGSDTARVGRPAEQHPSIAFFPLGGRALPVVAPTSLPGNLYQVDQFLSSRPVDGSGRATGPATRVSGAVDWTTVRGLFLVRGTLYYGLPDGTLRARTFDPSTGAAGPARVVPLYDDADGQRIPFDLAHLTGAFFDPSTNRIYYVVAGDPALHWRAFSPEDEVVGAAEHTAPSPGVDLSSAAGLTLAQGRVFFGSADGMLRSVLFAHGAVAGRPAVVSADGSWTGRGLFVAPGPAT